MVKNISPELTSVIDLSRQLGVTSSCKNGHFSKLFISIQLISQIHLDRDNLKKMASPTVVTYFDVINNIVPSCFPSKIL